MKSHIFLLCWLVFLQTGSLCAHSSDTAGRDSLLARLYDRAATLMEHSEYEAAQACFDSAFAMPGVAQRPIYPILLNEQATLFFYVGEQDRALAMKKQVLPYLPGIDDLEKHVSVYNDLGILYYRFNQPDSAVYCYNRALDAAQAYGDHSWLGNLHLNLAVFHFNLRKLEEAEKHIDQAVKHVVQTDDVRTLFAAWQVAAAVKAKVDKHPEAEKCIRKAWQLACGPQGSAEWKLRCIPSLYPHFQHKRQFDSIAHYVAIGNRLLKELPPTHVVSVGFIQMRAMVNFEQQRWKEALEDFVWLHTHPTGSEKKSLFEKMAVCYFHTRKFPEAYAYMDSARQWADTLASQKVTSQLAELKVKFETQQKELEIALLNKKLLKRETQQLKGGIALLAGLACLLTGVVWQRQKRKNAERRLQQLERDKELEAARNYLKGLEDECRYFAKELHDGIANDLLALELKAQLDKQQPMARSIHEVRENIRILSHELLPPEFKHNRLDDLLRHYVRFLNESTGICMRYNESDQPLTVPDSLADKVAREVYRIAQECLMNIVKHTSASTVKVCFAQEADDKICLRIADNGGDCPKPELQPGNRGIGLRTLNDRAKAINASVQTERRGDWNVFTLSFDGKEMP